MVLKTQWFSLHFLEGLIKNEDNTFLSIVILLDDCLSSCVLASFEKKEEIYSKV
jgi:hypothetical protein